MIKIAKFISVIGHPLLTIPLFVLIALFKYMAFNKALWISVLIIGVVFIPLIAKMYRGEKTGLYSNFDVSDQKQRQSWYWFPIFLLSIVIVILILTDQPRVLQIYILFFLLILVVSRLVNYIVKVSLHVSFAVFLSFLLFQMNFKAGVLFFIFSFLIAWARWLLKKHTIKEIASGFVVGALLGSAFRIILSGY